MEQPKIPTLKDAQKPQVKIKGLGAGLTLFDRLKQFKKKDLAFILAGLGTLFMAPLAEHFMMAPENGDSTLQKGWGGGSGAGGNLFGSGSSPYENGNNSIAQGGAIGGAGDIITPLNVRDPSALVMGPGQAQQPNAGSVTPPTAPPSAPPASSENYKDALAGAASRAASAAVKKAPLPIPKIAVGGSGLRGLGVAGGGSSASGGMAPLNSGNLGTAGTGGGGLNLVRSNPNFRGAAGPRGNGPQGLDGTKRAGQNAGDAFSRTGSALSGLNAAASEQIPTAGSGFNGNGQGGAGANDKSPGGSGPGGSKSVGESLAFIEAKERMMENLKLEFEKRKLKDPELLMYGIRNEVLKASALKVGEGLTKMAMCKGLGMDCPAPDDDYDCGGTTVNKSGMTECKGGGKDGGTPVDTGCWTIRGSVAVFKPLNGGAPLVCNATGKGKGATPDPKTRQAPSTAGGVLTGLAPEPGASAAANLNEFCTLLDKEIASQTKTKGTNADSMKMFNSATAMRGEVGKMVSKRDALYGTSAATSCGAADVRKGNSAYELHGTAIAALLEEGGVFTNGGIPDLVKLTTEPKGEINDKAIIGARAQHKKALDKLQEADNITVNMGVFTGTPFTASDTTLVKLIGNAKTANDGLVEYSKQEKGLLTNLLDPLIVRAENAGLKTGKPTVAEVVATNGSYAAMVEKAKAVDVIPGDKVEVKPDPNAPKPDPNAPKTIPKVDPATEAKGVNDAVTLARKDIGATDAEGALLAIKELKALKDKAEADKTPYVPDEAKKETINKAWKSWGEMQKKQTEALSSIKGSLKDMKEGFAPCATGGTPTFVGGTGIQQYRCVQ